VHATSTSTVLFISMETFVRQSGDQGFGVLLKSNGNGTIFAASLPMLDFIGYDAQTSRIESLEGHLISNKIVNKQEFLTTGEKKIQTVFSFDDGARWRPLIAPEADSRGKPYPCGAKTCSLHLHSELTRAADAYARLLKTRGKLMRVA